MLCGVENVEAQVVSYLQQLALESLRHKRKLGSVAKETQVAARFSILVKDQTSTLGELVILP